jgi:hypothetical protein
METLDKHFRSIAKAAFQKHGFASADLLSHWPDIIGAENAPLCAPDRIVWPRAKAEGESPAGTLVLRAAPGRSLDVQYKAEHLLERINTYLGYRAIARIKVEGTLPHTSPKPDSPPVSPAPAISGVEDPDLAEALARLGARVRTEKSRSPQGQ